MLIRFPMNDPRGFAIGDTILQFELLKVNGDNTVLAEVRTIGVESIGPSTPAAEKVVERAVNCVE